MPLIKKDPINNAFNGLVNRGVLKDDVRGFSAQLEGDSLVGSSEGALDEFSDRGRAGEGHALDARVRREARADHAAAGEKLDCGSWNPRLVHKAHGEMGDERGLLGGLGENGVAGGQCCRDLAGEDGEGEVPRADAGPDAAGGKGIARRHGLGRVVAQEIDRLAQLQHGIEQRLARLALAQAEKLRSMRLEEVGGIVEGSQHKELAQKFLSFMMEPGFQDQIPTNNWMFPAGKTSAPLPPAFDQLVKPAKTLLYSPEEVDQNRRAWIDEWLNATAK